MPQTLAAINIGQSLQSMLDSLARIIPRIVAFIIILIIGWIVAKIIQKVAALILARLHFDRVGERGVVGDALRRGDFTASTFLAKLFYYGILLVTLQLAFQVFGTNPVSTLLNSVVAWLPKALVAIIIIVIASAIAHVVKDLVAAALGGVSYGGFVANMTSIFIVALGTIAALNQIGIATSVLEPLLITVLATIGAILAIGIGGGMIRPMQERWERILSSGEREAASMRSGAYQRGREDARRGGRTPVESPTQQHDTPH